MPNYQLFGGTLRSQVLLPELRPSTSAAPHWELSTVARPRPVANLVALGREQVEATVEVTLASHDAGLRLVFDDTGTFDILRGGRVIEWSPPSEPNLDSVRKDLLGRVFAVALGEQGVLTLHGSAVSFGEQAAAFLAPKFHGKSTTATALVNAGARLLADDLVPVTQDEVPMVLPSVPLVHLWNDSADRVANGSASAPAEGGSPKRQVAWTDPSRVAGGPVRLAAIYLLAPVQSHGGIGVQRHLLTGVEAALALLGQTKIGALLGVERRAALLGRLAGLAGKLPVYRLEIPRDFDRLRELTTRLLGWHGARPHGPATTGRSA